MQRRVTYYTCDRCEVEVPKKSDLHRYSLYSYRARDEVAFDLCGACEGEFFKKTLWLEVPWRKVAA